ncbi:MAG: Rho termination factor N-terminal domain-containing protein [Clostridium sp.]|uniref:Rho termination factor N-terminal domain-containing protein n=1 Tax=Clostridium TaxID=1485 RepID=UPI00232A917E|nr:MULTISPECIES: Rho termination factor N-terminal domain-containing protein [Clostridium]MDB2119969.1 Rho termination factor N-terminal domain-containing protein [Clostridium paraputrificum]MDU2754719.1 Rho termination factor N-terminal domain-containing protein [Clostridium sp.]MDU2899667.1 Rho termination factor N-terminal domain-containing protein [Clostridium sp.]MDU4426360.1 Rho termination factor N-terminal domain-containing protein [Clostridium sp.]MDU4788406.1 Rho termination factor N
MSYNMDKNKVIKISKLVFDYVLNMDDKSIDKLLYGQAKLEIKEKEKKIKNDEKRIKISNFINMVVELSDKNDVRNLINKEKLTVKELKDIAKALNISLRSKAVKSEIIDKIVEGTAGAKIKMNILKNDNY